jgi:UPF0042 nucleotide-binding protein
MNGTSPMRVLLVTGLSGAGRSSAMSILEDLGYETVDNVPLRLIKNLVATAEDAPAKAFKNWGEDHPSAGLAIGVDVRSQGFSAQACQAILSRLEQDANITPSLVFFDCDDDILERRYEETRRRHPLAIDRKISDGIHLEREALAPLRKAAHHLIDTSKVSLRDLRELVISRFGEAESPGLSIHVLSFSYRQGLPRDADLVFDVRFLRNPHYEPALKPKNGQDADVGAFILADDSFDAFEVNLKGLLDVLLPGYQREGKSYLTLGFGCTGGQHRSVFMAQRVSEALANQGYRVNTRHRELNN